MSARVADQDAARLQAVMDRSADCDDDELELVAGAVLLRVPVLGAGVVALTSSGRGGAPHSCATCVL